MGEHTRIGYVSYMRKSKTPRMTYPAKSAVYFLLPDSCLITVGRLPAVYINFVQITHQIQVLTEPLCRARAIFMRCRTKSGVPNIVG